MQGRFSFSRAQLLAGAALILILAGASGYCSYTLFQRYRATALELASTTSALQTAEGNAAELTDQLTAERERNDAFASQIANISGTVGTLTKLSETDKELLQKYSKIYFLNENYVPQQLATITPSYTLEPSRTYQFHAKALSYLIHMLDNAKVDGVNLLVLSSYRSYGDQINLKISYKTTYGFGANQFSADQGYSEHQLGTAVDFTTPLLHTTTLAFGTSDAGKWLDANAYKYGFIQSYPKGNKFYQYEPWHWRFVGVRLATYLHDHALHFYDLDQRTIDTYLVDVFD